MYVVQLGCESLLLRRLAQAAKVRRFGVHLGESDLASFAEADDSRNVKRAGTHAALVAAAIDLSSDLHGRRIGGDERRERRHPWSP